MRTISGTVGLAACVAVSLSLLPESSKKNTSPHAPDYRSVIHHSSAPVATAVRTAQSWLQTIGAVTATADAQSVPAIIQHQGVVMVNGKRYTGPGQFKFAIVDPDTGDNLWANDGTTTGQPGEAVSLSLNDGVYSVELGNTSIGNMASLDPAIFADDDPQLIIWFDDGTHGWQQLSPQSKLTSVPYALRSAVAADVDPESITATKLANDYTSLTKVSGGFVTATVEGYIGVGTTTPYAPLVVSGTAVSDYMLVRPQDPAYGEGGEVFLEGAGTFDKIRLDNKNGEFRIIIGNEWNALWKNNGHFHLVGGAWSDGSSWHNASSRALKDHIEPVDAHEATATLKKLQPVTFNYKNNPDEQCVGFIAEDVPELVAVQGRKSTSSMDIIGVLTKVVQEQQAAIETYKSRLDEQQAMIEKLTDQVAAMQQDR